MVFLRRICSSRPGDWEQRRQSVAVLTARGRGLDCLQPQPRQPVLRQNKLRIFRFRASAKAKDTEMVAAAFSCEKGEFMGREPFEAMPDVMDAKQLAEALQISKVGAYNLLSSPDFPTLRIGGRKLVMKNELVEWLKSRTNRTL